MIPDDVTQAYHWWRVKKIAPQGKIIAPEEIQNSLAHCMIILRFMYKSLDSLYIASQNIPPLWSERTGVSMRLGGSYNMIIHLDITPNNYRTLRTVLALTGDVYSSCKGLIDVGMGYLAELESPLRQLYNDADYFRDIRNFFTHMDEVLSRPDKHGVSGPYHNDDCGIDYSDTVKGCVHLVTIGNKIYYTFNAVAREIDIAKPHFTQIFDSARQVYIELIKHTPSHLATHYLKPDEVYPYYNAENRR